MSKTEMERFVGIDVSKDSVDVHIDPCDGQAWQHLAYDDAGVRALCRRLQALAPTLIVLEATGGLETRLASELVALGLPVAVVNPRQVRDYARCTGELAKTDRIDARVLCAFARAIKPEPRGIAIWPRGSWLSCWRAAVSWWKCACRRCSAPTRRHPSQRKRV